MQYPIYVHPLCVLESDGVSECYTGLECRINSIQIQELFIAVYRAFTYMLYVIKDVYN